MTSISDLPNRLRSKIIEDDLTGCWLWRGAFDSSGYGSVKYQGKTFSSHRLVYTLLVGPIPDQLDHLCTDRECCNPEHLELVSKQENIKRRNTDNIGSTNRNKTHCPQNHPYDEENTYTTSDGWRQCRICKDARNKCQVF